MRTRVKICGFTQIDDALCAAYLGVDAIGLVFYPPSPRNIAVEKAVALIKRLPAFVSKVALFVDAQPDLITHILSQVEIDCLQFHGNELADACRSYGKPYIKAVSMQADTNLSKLEQCYHDASGLLLDTFHPGLPGGSGVAFNWSLIPEKCKLPIILAGGLSPDNVSLAIKTVRPYALDVSSGVESAKGLKDAEKMAAFIRNTNKSIEYYD